MNTDVLWPDRELAEAQVLRIQIKLHQWAIDDPDRRFDDVTRWLGGLGVASRTGKTRWDRSVVWGMLRNPAYAGRACFGKTMRTEQPAGLDRRARLAGRSTPRHYTVVDRPREDWLEIPVPALVAEDTWHRVQRRLEDNKRYASRNSTNPSLLQGICVCASCGYAYYRTSTRTTTKIIYYYRCLGSDDYRYEHGRVCANKPVRADYLDGVVWDHISDLLADPALIRTEITKRLAQVRTTDPATVQRKRLHAGLAKAREAITRLIGAYQEQLISLDELRSRMPELRTRETSLRQQIDALDAQLADRAVYLKLADNLEDFLAGLRSRAAAATVAERQRVLRLLVKDVLVGPDKIIIRHSIPARHNPSNATESSPDTDSEGETRPDCQLRWRSPAPLLANVALSVLDEHFAESWRATGDSNQRVKRRRAGLANYRIVRYADDFVVLVAGTKAHAETLREEVAAVLAPMGLRLSEAKTTICHIDEGFDFLGFHIQRRRKRGTGSTWSTPIRRIRPGLDRRAGPHADQQNVAPDACGHAAPAQPGVAGLVHLLQARGVQSDLRLSRPVHLAPSSPMDPQRHPRTKWDLLTTLPTQPASAEDGVGCSNPRR